MDYSCVARFVYQTKPVGGSGIAGKPFIVASDILREWFTLKLASEDVAKLAQKLLECLPPAEAVRVIPQIELGGSVFDQVHAIMSKLVDFALLAEPYSNLEAKGEYVQSLAILLCCIVDDLPHKRTEIENLIYYYANPS